MQHSNRLPIAAAALALAGSLLVPGATGCRHAPPDATRAPAPVPTDDGPDDDGWRIERLGDGIWAALQPAERRFDDSNSLIVAGDGAALVVDSQASLERTRALIERTKALTPHPVRWLINTHWHGDHTNGNSAWREAWPELTIVGHDTIRDDIVGRAMPDHLERTERWQAAIDAAVERLARGVDREGNALDETGRATLVADIDDTRLRVAGMREIAADPPAVTLTDVLTIRLGERVVELHAHRAHTQGDVIVLVPDAGVLASGDLLDDLPFGGHGYPTSWLAALEQIDRLEFETIVPGHGPVFDGRGQLELLQELLRAALDGFSLEHPAMQQLRSRFAGEDPVAARNWDAFIPALLERVVAEHRGELD